MKKRHFGWTQVSSFVDCLLGTELLSEDGMKAVLDNWQRGNGVLAKRVALLASTSWLQAEEPTTKDVSLLGSEEELLDVAVVLAKTRGFAYIVCTSSVVYLFDIDPTDDTTPEDDIRQGQYIFRCKVETHGFSLIVSHYFSDGSLQETRKVDHRIIGWSDETKIVILSNREEG